MSEERKQDLKEMYKDNFIMQVLLSQKGVCIHTNGELVKRSNEVIPLEQPN